MPTFKQYLDALFKTRTTPAEATSANAPDWSKKIQIYSGTGSQQITHVAPSNGYFMQHVNGYPSHRYNRITAPNGTLAFVAQSPESSSLFRVSKGDQVAIAILSFENVHSRTVNFIPCLGGGYRLLLKALQSGGAPCLRLKNCSTLWRRESESRKTLGRLQSFPHNRETGFITTSRRRMEGFGFSQMTAIRYASPMYTPGKCTTSTTSSEKKTIRFLKQSNAKRGIKSTSTMGQPKCRRTYGAISFLTKALPSLCANRMEVRHVA